MMPEKFSIRCPSGLQMDVGLTERIHRIDKSRV